MSDQIEDGGPAFPRAGDQLNHPVDGMSLRDWFAGQALAGLCAADTEWIRDFDDIARLSYVQADAMLAARRKT